MLPLKTAKIPQNIDVKLKAIYFFINNVIGRY